MKLLRVEDVEINWLAIFTGNFKARVAAKIYIVIHNTKTVAYIWSIFRSLKACRLRISNRVIELSVV